MAGISFSEFVNGGGSKKGSGSSKGVSVSEFLSTDFNKKKKPAIDFSQYDPDILNSLKQDSSSWTYDLFDAEDMQRKAQGLMPKSLADDYDLDDPVDKALYEGGYVSRKNFSKGYQQAERNNASKADFNTEVIKGVQAKLTSDPEKTEKQAFDEVFEELRKSDSYKSAVKADDKDAFFKQYAKGSMQSKLADAPNEFEVNTSDRLNRKDGALGSVGLPQMGKTYTAGRMETKRPELAPVHVPTEADFEEIKRKAEEARKEEKGEILTSAAKYDESSEARADEIDKRVREINRALNRTGGVQQAYINPDKRNALLEERNALQAELGALHGERSDIVAGRNASALAPFYKTTKAADFAQNSEYDPSRARTEDILYSFINGQEPAQTSMLNPMGINAPSSTSDPNYAFAYMTDEEKSIYNYLVNTGGDDKAFLAAVRPYANERMRNAVEAEARAYAEDRPVLSSLQTIATSPVSAIEGLIGLGKTGINTIAGRDTDPNDPVFQNTRKNNAIRETVANTIKAENQGFVGEALAMLYQTGMSMGDTAVRLPMGAAGLGVAGLSAAASAMDDALSRGATSGQALASGLMNGAAEVVFEKVSLDNLVSMSRAGNIQDVVKNILKQGGVEASEEAFTEIANTISDAVIMADKSAYEIAVRDYMANGMTEQVARQLASMDSFKAIMDAGIGGFISGGAFGTGGQMMALGQTALTGRAIDNAGMTDTTVMEGLTYPETSEAYKMAAAADLENINYLDVGRQFYANAEAANQQARMAFEQEVATATGSQEHTAAAMKLFDRMAQGVADQKLVKAFGKIQETIRATTAKKAEIDAELETENMRIEAKLSGAYNKMVTAMEAGDVNAFNAAKHAYLSQYKIEQAEARLAKLKAENKTAAETAKTQAVVEEASLAFETEERNQLQREAQTKIPAQIKPAVAGRSDSGAAYTPNAKTVPTRKQSEPADNRVERNKPQPKPQRVENSKPETPKKATTRKTASNKDVETSKAVFRKLEPSDHKLLTDKFGSDAETVAAEMYARYRQEVEGEVAEDIPDHVKEKFFEAFEEADSGHTETAEGEVIYQTETEEDEQVGDQKGYGLKHEYDKRMLSEADRKVLKNSKNELRLLDTIAKMGKVDIALVPTIKGINVGGRTMQSAPNGVYDRQNSKIYVALDAQGGAISYIAFHELTHYIAQHSPKGYSMLQKVVFDALGESKVRQLVSEQVERHGYSEKVAREEVLANSIPAILTDKQYVEKLVKLDPHAASKIKQIIDAILDALTRQFVDLSAINPDFAPMKDLKESVETLRKMQAAFDASLAEASWSRDVDPELVSEMGGGVTFTPVGEVAQIQNKDGTAILSSERTWYKGGRDLLKETLELNGFSQTDVKRTITGMDDVVNFLRDYANRRGYDRLEEALSAEVIVSATNGKIVLHTLTSNGDYPVNFDLSLTCKKRVAYQRVLKELAKSGLFNRVTIAGEAIARINEILRKNGFETACPACFVEARRQQIQTWAETFAERWNTEVDKRNPNADTFDFGNENRRLSDEEIEALDKQLSAGEKNKRGNQNLGKGSVQTKIGVLLDRVPALQKRIKPETLITPEGVTALRGHSADVYSLLLQNYGTATPKPAQEFHPYNSDAALLTFAYMEDVLGKSALGKQEYLDEAAKELGLKTGDPKVQELALMRYLYDIGGARSQSFSDFVIENVLDKLQLYADVAARRFPMHEYTKEIASARIFGMTGAKQNMSVIHYIDRSMGKEYAGLTRDSKGDLTYIASDAEAAKRMGIQAQSIGFKDAVALQNDPRYSKYVGTIAIGFSDKHIELMLGDNNIRMVIPYHASGINPAFAKATNVDMAKDYTKLQNTSVETYYNLDGTVSNGTIGGNVNTTFLFDKALQENNGDPRAAAKAYLEWCAEKHLIIKDKTVVGYATFKPKFSGGYVDGKTYQDFTKHPNYYKLLEDFNCIDTVTRKPAKQGPVTQTYPSAKNRLTDKQLAAYEERLRKTGLYTEAEIKKYSTIAQKSLTELIGDELSTRQEYNERQDAKFSGTMQEINSMLEEDFVRASARTTRDAEYMSAVESNELRFSDRAEEPASNQISQAAKIRAEAERLFAAGVTPQKYLEMHPDGKGFSVRVSRLLIGMWLKAGKNIGGKISDDGMNAIMQNRDFFDFKGIFGTGVGKNVKLNLISPLRVFEQLGNWRPGKDAESRTLNYLEGEALKETFFNPVMNAGAYANLFMEKESEKIKAKLEVIPKADRQMMACLTQLAGENLASEAEVNRARFGKNGMLVRTKLATYVFNKDGQITAISSRDEETNETTLAIFDDNYYRRIRESQKDIEAIMGKRNAAMSSEEKNKRVSEIKQRARQNKPVVLQGKDLVIYEGGSNLKVESPMGKVLLELNDAKSPTAGPVMDLAAALRDFYERVYKMQSKVLVEAGYAPVPHRPDYFPHQGRESTGIMDSILTILMGEPDKIPTEIIGKTGQFKPGKPFVNHLLARLGESTEYDAIRGFNRYLRSAADLMYYTPAIQRLRQLENFLRQESVGSQNSEIVAWLQEYTNSIANKKHSLDRGGEAFIGREAYTFTDKLAGLFGAAAVSGNLSTALSNNISLLTAIPGIEKKYLAKAAKDAWKSAWTEVIRGGTGDRFLEKVPFLARRLGGYEALLTNEAKMAGRKVNNFLGAMFAFTDRFAVETAARAKYAELMAKGDTDTVRKTNEFMLKNFADRSKGMMPTIYNMRLLRLITQFQLEGQNQFSHFGDINRANVGKQIEKQLTQEQIREIMSRGYADIDWSKIHINTRDPKKFASKMLYLLLLSLWGAFTRLTMGQDQTWNPAGMAIDFATAIKDDDMKGAFSKLGQDMIDQIPFVQTFTGGGRIPAFGGVQNVIDAVPAIFDKDSTGDLAKITQGAAAFVPGGAQASKTIRGIDAYVRGGSYSGKGNLRYPVEQNTGNLVRSVLFGPASNQPRGYDYLTDTLTEKKTGAYKELIEVGVKPTEAYDALRAYGGDTNAAKLTSLAEADVDEKTRKLIANAMGLKLGEGSIKSQAKAEAKEYLEGKEKQYKSGKITKADLEAADRKTQDLIKRLLDIK